MMPYGLDDTILRYIETIKPMKLRVRYILVYVELIIRSKALDAAQEVAILLAYHDPRLHGIHKEYLNVPIS